jgi:hypothetical protein
MDSYRAGEGIITLTPALKVLVQQQQKPRGLQLATIPYVDVRNQLPTRNKTDRYPIRNINLVDSVDIHYTAGPASTGVIGTAQYQVGPSAQLDFPEIAYHMFVNEDGTLYLCHNLDIRTWHNGGYLRNEKAWAICYAGNVQPNNRQMISIRNGILLGQELLKRTVAVYGHRDNYATTCPGESWRTWRPLILA